MDSGMAVGDSVLGALALVGGPFVIGASLLIPAETFQPASIGRLPFVVAAIGDTL